MSYFLGDLGLFAELPHFFFWLKIVFSSSIASTIYLKSLFSLSKFVLNKYLNENYSSIYLSVSLANEFIHAYKFY